MTAHQSALRDKVVSLLRSCPTESVDRVCHGLADGDVVDNVSSALQGIDGFDEQTARDIGFHLSDWHAEGAFLLALHLYPSSFSQTEIAEGVRDFLIHAPNHVAAAAALADCPVSDIFETGRFGSSAID